MNNSNDSLNLTFNFFFLLFRLFVIHLADSLINSQLSSLNPSLFLPVNNNKHDIPLRIPRTIFTVPFTPTHNLSKQNVVLIISLPLNQVAPFTLLSLPVSHSNNSSIIYFYSTVERNEKTIF